MLYGEIIARATPKVRFTTDYKLTFNPAKECFRASPFFFPSAFLSLSLSLCQYVWLNRSC